MEKNGQWRMKFQKQMRGRGGWGMSCVAILCGFWARTSKRWLGTLRLKLDDRFPKSLDASHRPPAVHGSIFWGF